MKSPTLFAAHSPQEFIHQFQAGDQKVFSLVFRKHYSKLCFFAGRLTGNDSAGQDIVGESFTSLWERRSRFKDSSSIKAFLFISTRNACINYIRKNKLQSKYNEAWAHTREHRQEPVLQDIIRTEAVAEIHTRIMKLPPACRQVFLLLYVEGLTPMETGARLNISVNTVRNHRIRGVRLLQQRV